MSLTPFAIYRTPSGRLARHTGISGGYAHFVYVLRDGSDDVVPAKVGDTIKEGFSMSIPNCQHFKKVRLS